MLCLCCVGFARLACALLNCVGVFGACALFDVVCVVLTFNIVLV